MGLKNRALQVLGESGIVPTGGTVCVVNEVDLTIRCESLFPAFWQRTQNLRRQGIQSRVQLCSCDARCRWRWRS